MSDLFPFIRHVIAGECTCDYIVLPDGRVKIKLPGGEAFFAAAAARFWDENIGIVSAVHSSYPKHWLQSLKERQIDLSGVQIAYGSECFHERHLVYDHWSSNAHVDPLFFKLYQGSTHPNGSQPYPPLLVNKHEENPPLFPLKIKNLPFHLRDSGSILFCSLPFSLYPSLVNYFSIHSEKKLFWNVPGAILIQQKWVEVMQLCRTMTTLFFQQSSLQLFARHNGISPGKLIKLLFEQGCENILLINDNKDVWLCENLVNCFEIPFYPFSRRIDPTPFIPTFCGAFMASLHHSGDPLVSACRAAATASVAIESSGALNLWQAMPELVHERAAYLQRNLVSSKKTTESFSETKNGIPVFTDAARFPL